MKKIDLNKNDFRLAGLLLFLFLAGVLLMRTGVFSVDESSMVLGFDGLSKTGSLQILNNYEKYGSEELNAYKGVVYRGTVWVKYPPLYFYLVNPFYSLFGVSGLFWANLLAGIAAAFVFYRLVVEISGDEIIGLSTLVILFFATFFLEYTIAIWPHMLAILIIVSSIYFFRRGMVCSSFVGPYFFYSGLLIGVAIGVRLTSVLPFLLLNLLLLWEGKKIFRRLIAFYIGVFAPLGLISFINLQRFGLLNPIAGSTDFLSSVSMVSLVVPAILVFISVFIMWYIRKQKKYSSKKKNLSLLILSILPIGLSLVFYAKEFFYYIRNFIAYTLNMYFMPTMEFEGAAYLESGVLTYNGIIKKALLQSCPFLVLIFLTPYFLKKINISKTDKRLLILISLGYPLFVSLFHFHGGMGYNFRYLLELLPWGAFITVLWIQTVPFTRVVVERFVFAIVLFALVFTLLPEDSAVSIIIIMIIPSILAVSLLIIPFTKKLIKNKKVYNNILGILIVVSLALGFSMEYFKDLPATLRKRADNKYRSRLVYSSLPNNSFLFVYWGYKDALAVAKARMPLTIADFHYDEGRDFFTLLEMNLSEGNPVYLYGEGIHPELLELLQIEYTLNNISDEIIPIYHIRKKLIILSIHIKIQN